MSTPLWQNLIGEVLDQRFRLIELRESGRYQAEFLAQPVEADSTDPALMSITLLQAEGEEAQQLCAEIREASQFQHENLLRILSTGITSFQDTGMVYLATEAPTGSLAQLLSPGPISTGQARELIEHILSGLAYLHGRGYVYAILHPETVVQVGDQWKLADLGELQPIGQVDEIPIVIAPGRAAYVPTEAETGSITPAWDMWGVGALLREALQGAHGRQTRLAPSPFREIIEGCLRTDPSSRLSVAQVRQLLDPAAPPLVSEQEPVLAGGYAAPIREKLSRGVTDTRAEVEVGGLTQHPGRLVLLAGVSCLALLAGWMGLRNSASAPPSASAANPVVTRTTPAPRPSPALAPSQDKPSPMREPARDNSRPRAKVTPPPAPAPARTQPAPAVPAPAPAASAAPAAAGSTTAETGRADFFSSSGDGGLTASGERVNSRELTAAHPRFRMGTRLRVTNLSNGKSVVVRVNDRRSASGGRVISVSQQAAETLGFVKAGSASVRIEVVP